VCAACALAANAQDVIFVPSCEPMVRVLTDSYCSANDETRETSIRWLRERASPAAFGVLFRAKNDPSQAIRFEAMLGLSEIAPEYRLDAFQMRNLEPDERARLIRLASDQGQIDAVSLRSIAKDSSASGIERAQAMQELSRLGRPVSAESWVPLLGVEDAQTQLIAALAVVTDEPRSRAVALAQDHAIGVLRQSVVDASQGKISTVIAALREARRAPTKPLADWASALMKACKGRTSPEQKLVWREAIQTLLIVDPSKPGLERQWKRAWNAAKDNPGDSATLAFRAFEAGCIRHDEAVQTPAWLAATISQTDAGDSVLIGSLADALDSMARNQAFDADVLVEIIESGGVRVREHTLTVLFSLPATTQVPALVSLLEHATKTGLEPWLVRQAAREFAALDPAAAREQLIAAHERGDEAAAIALVLAGAWPENANLSHRLQLMRSLWSAERMVEGARSEERASLADELALIVDEGSGFAMPIRAEAAWLAMVLRDQTSEAMAHLPRRQNSVPGDSSQGGEHADSPLQWAQMQYP